MDDIRARRALGASIKMIDRHEAGDIGKCHGSINDEVSDHQWLEREENDKGSYTLITRSRALLAICQLSLPFFHGEYDYVTDSNHLPRYGFDRCRPRLRRNCRFLRGSGENPFRRLPHFRGTVIPGRWAPTREYLEVKRDEVSSASLGGL